MATLQKCKLKHEGNVSKLGRKRVQALCAFAEPAPSGFSDAFWKILSDMNQEDVVVTLKKLPP